MRTLASLLASRRGEGDETLGWSAIALILYVISVGICAILLIFTMFDIAQAKTDIPLIVREEALVTRLLLAPDCLAASDPASGRIEGSVINWSRLASNDALTGCYAGDETDWSLKVTVERASGAYRTVNSTHYRLAGPPDSTITRAVLVRDGAALEAGTLKVFIQT